MSTPTGNGEKDEDRHVDPRDLIDFYRRWSDFRPSAVSLTQRPDLSPGERQTIHWLILLADRIRENDLNP